MIENEHIVINIEINHLRSQNILSDRYSFMICELDNNLINI